MILRIGSSQRSTDRQRGAQKGEGMTKTIAFIVSACGDEKVR